MEVSFVGFREKLISCMHRQSDRYPVQVILMSDGKLNRLYCYTVSAKVEDI